MGFNPYTHVIAEILKRVTAQAAEPYRMPPQKSEPELKDAEVLDVRHGDNDGALPPPQEIPCLAPSPPTS